MAKKWPKNFHIRIVFVMPIFEPGAWLASQVGSKLKNQESDLAQKYVDVDEYHKIFQKSCLYMYK